jgi:hypothetical protein
MASREKDFDDWVWELADGIEGGIGAVTDRIAGFFDFLTGAVIDRMAEENRIAKDSRAGNILPAVPGPLKKGDVIFAQRKAYRHYGIYAGKNRVIHYAGKEHRMRSRTTIEAADLREFSKGDPVYAVRFPEKTDFLYSPGETVRRARSRIGTTDYNLVFNNCEHFAYWCKTGKRESSQVQEVCERLFNKRFEFDELGNEIAEKFLDLVFGVSGWIGEKIEEVL